MFAQWQPQYAQHGVALFPVRPNKIPAVKGYLRIGPRVSDQLVMKFADSAAFGLACRRSKITVLDVDTPDEKVLADGLAQHGQTPFIVRSGSGNFQAWYRHNGEGRRIRPDPSKPIDILGDGFVVAPPSKGAKGNYEIILGSLDDLDHLPPMRAPEPATDIEPNAHRQPSAAKGERNNQLWRHCMKAARGCREIEHLMEVAMKHNREAFYEPLPADEVLRIVASAWGYEVEGKNWVGYGPRVIVDHSVVDSLASEQPHAFALFGILQRDHWGRDFILANAYATKLGWTLRTFRDARNILCERGLIECVQPGGRGPSDPPIYRFPKVSDYAHQ